MSRIYHSFKDGKGLIENLSVFDRDSLFIGNCHNLFGLSKNAVIFEEILIGELEAERHEKRFC